MACSSGNKICGIVCRDTTADLQSARICSQRRERLCLCCRIIIGIHRIEQDHMSTTQPPRPVQRGIICRRAFTHKIFCRHITCITQTAANDLFDLAIMDIYTGSELHF